MRPNAGRVAYFLIFSLLGVCLALLSLLPHLSVETFSAPLWAPPLLFLDPSGENWIRIPPSQRPSESAAPPPPPLRRRVVAVVCCCCCCFFARSFFERAAAAGSLSSISASSLLRRRETSHFRFYSLFSLRLRHPPPWVPFAACAQIERATARPSHSLCPLSRPDVVSSIPVLEEVASRRQAVNKMSPPSRFRKHCR